MKFVKILVTFFVIIGICILGIYFGNKVNEKINLEKESIYEDGYVDACRDMYKGTLKYELKTNEDGSITWQRNNKLNAWDDKNYFDAAMLTCPKCGSIRIIGNVPRDRGVITAFKCLDCGYTWKKK